MKLGHEVKLSPLTFEYIFKNQQMCLFWETMSWFLVSVSTSVTRRIWQWHIVMTERLIHKICFLKGEVTLLISDHCNTLISLAGNTTEQQAAKYNNI